MDCIFCERIRTGSFDLKNDFAVAFPDGYPVSPGHTLIVARRHEADFFALPVGEQAGMVHLAQTCQAALTATHHPDGFNLGLNAGVAAGQTVMHVHLHLIPRYHGDVPHPRGGVRHVIPGKGETTA